MNFTLIFPNIASIKTCSSLSSHVLNKPKDDFFLAYLVTDLNFITSEILFVASELVSCVLAVQWSHSEHFYQVKKQVVDCLS